MKLDRTAHSYYSFSRQPKARSYYANLSRSERIEVFIELQKQSIKWMNTQKWIKRILAADKPWVIYSTASFRTFCIRLE